jgi:hypothetical protein
MKKFEDSEVVQLKEINQLKTRLRSNKPELPLASYTGAYSNPLYGNIEISRQENRLLIQFKTKPDLTATLDYLDNGDWLLNYNNIEYGIFKVQFELESGKVKSLTTKQNSFVEYDPYVFTKIP